MYYIVLLYYIIHCYTQILQFILKFKMLSEIKMFWFYNNQGRPGYYRAQKVCFSKVLGKNTGNSLNSRIFFRVLIFILI